MPYAGTMPFYPGFDGDYQDLGFRARISKKQAQSSFIRGVGIDDAATALSKACDLQ